MSIMEADEYMNPKMGSTMPGPSRLGSTSTAGTDMLGPMHNRHNWELRKFGDIHRIGKNKWFRVKPIVVKSMTWKINTPDRVFSDRL